MRIAASADRSPRTVRKLETAIEAVAGRNDPALAGLTLRHAVELRVVRAASPPLAASDPPTVLANHPPLAPVGVAPREVVVGDGGRPALPRLGESERQDGCEDGHGLPPLLCP